MNRRTFYTGCGALVSLKRVAPLRGMKEQCVAYRVDAVNNGDKLPVHIEELDDQTMRNLASLAGLDSDKREAILAEEID